MSCNWTNSWRVVNGCYYELQCLDAIFVFTLSVSSCCREEGNGTAGLGPWRPAWVAFLVVHAVSQAAGLDGSPLLASSSCLMYRLGGGSIIRLLSSLLSGFLSRLSRHSHPKAANKTGKRNKFSESTEKPLPNPSLCLEGIPKGSSHSRHASYVIV